MPVAADLCLTGFRENPDVLGKMTEPIRPDISRIRKITHLNFFLSDDHPMTEQRTIFEVLTRLGRSDFIFRRVLPSALGCTTVLTLARAIWSCL